MNYLKNKRIFFYN